MNAPTAGHAEEPVDLRFPDIHICAWSTPLNEYEHVVSSHALVLWLNDGPRMDFQRGSRHWRTQPKRGRLDYYPPCCIDRLRAEAPGRALVLDIGAALVARAEQAIGRPWSPPAEPEHQFKDARLENIMLSIQALADRSAGPLPAGAGHQLAINAMSLLEERHAAHGSLPGGTLTSSRRRILEDYIETHLNGDLEITALACSSGYSLGHFARLFKHAFGVPPHQYILERRIEKAKKVLSSSDRGLSELAYDLGFSSHAHFSTAFRARTGTTPQEFRRRLGRRALQHAA